jgi:hypothetical protein
MSELEEVENDEGDEEDGESEDNEREEDEANDEEEGEEKDFGDQIEEIQREVRSCSIIEEFGIKSKNSRIERILSNCTQRV